MKQFSKELGKVSITPKGAWNSNITNERLDIVYDKRNNQAYIAKQNVPVGVDIDNREYWQPMNVTGYADNNFINLTTENENGTITAYESIEEAVATIFPINRRAGATLSFFNLNTDRLDRQAEFELWQFNSTDLANWENRDYWNNIYYNWNVFVGWYIGADALNNHVKLPTVGQYAYVGTNLNDALLYQCRTNGTWTNTGIKVRNYISVVVSGNITIGNNGNWFSDGKDTGIPATPSVDEQLDNIIMQLQQHTTEISNLKKSDANLQDQITSNDSDITNLTTKHESLSRTVQGIAATGGASTANNVTYNNDTSGLNAENAQDAIDELQSSKFDKTSILQESGEAEDKVMSQKAVSDKLSDLDNSKMFLSLNKDGYVNTDGVFVDNINFKNSGYIPLALIDNIEGSLTESTVAYTISYYDENLAFLGGNNLSDRTLVNITSLSVPENSKYVLVCQGLSVINNYSIHVTLNKSSVALNDFIDFKKEITNKISFILFRIGYKINTTSTYNPRKDNNLFCLNSNVAGNINSISIKTISNSTYNIYKVNRKTKNIKLLAEVEGGEDGGWKSVNISEKLSTEETIGYIGKTSSDLIPLRIENNNLGESIIALHNVDYDLGTFKNEITSKSILLPLFITGVFNYSNDTVQNIINTSETLKGLVSTMESDLIEVSKSFPTLFINVGSTFKSPFKNLRIEGIEYTESIYLRQFDYKPSDSFDIILTLGNVNGKNITFSMTKDSMTTRSGKVILDKVVVYFTLADFIQDKYHFFTDNSDDNSNYICPSVFTIENINKENIKTVSDKVNYVTGIIQQYKDAKVLMFGDSFIDYGVYPTAVQNLLKCNIINRGVGGSTIVRRTDKPNQSLICRLFNEDNAVTTSGNGQALPESCDVVIVHAGVNDFVQDRELGSIDLGMSDDSKIYSAIQVILYNLIKKYPNAQIIWDTPCHFKSRTSDNKDFYYDESKNLVEVRKRCTLKEIAIAIKECCALYGVKVADMYSESGICPELEENSTLYTKDGLHPSELGAKKLAKILAKEL